MWAWYGNHIKDYKDFPLGNDLNLEFYKTKFCNIGENISNYSFSIPILLNNEHVTGDYKLYDGDKLLDYNLIDNITLEISWSKVFILDRETVDFYKKFYNYDYTEILEKIISKYNIPNDILYIFKKYTIDDSLPIPKPISTIYNTPKLVIRLRKNIKKLNIKFNVYRIKHIGICTHFGNSENCNKIIRDGRELGICGIKCETKIYQTIDNFRYSNNNIFLCNKNNAVDYVLGISNNIIDNITINNNIIRILDHYNYDNKIVNIYKLPYIDDDYILNYNPFIKIYAIKYNILRTMSGLQGLGFG